LGLGLSKGKVVYNLINVFIYTSYDEFSVRARYRPRLRLSLRHRVRLRLGTCKTDKGWG
jgi:hypothetical protein